MNFIGSRFWLVVSYLIFQDDFPPGFFALFITMYFKPLCNNNECVYQMKGKQNEQWIFYVLLNSPNS